MGENKSWDHSGKGRDRDRGVLPVTGHKDQSVGMFRGSGERFAIGSDSWMYGIPWLIRIKE